MGRLVTNRGAADMWEDSTIGASVLTVREHVPALNEHRPSVGGRDPQPASSSLGAAALQQSPRRIALLLTAFRCPSCGRDWVLDTDGQAWDLDETDYTDRGSWP